MISILQCDINCIKFSTSFLDKIRVNVRTKRILKIGAYMYIDYVKKKNKVSYLQCFLDLRPSLSLNLLANAFFNQCIASSQHFVLKLKLVSDHDFAFKDQNFSMIFENSCRHFKAADLEFVFLNGSGNQIDASF